MSDSDNLSARLRALLGKAAVIDELSELEFLSTDVYSAGVTAALAIVPSSREVLPDAIGTITAAGYAVVPRGGGMSYTSGYTPILAKSVIVDLRQLNNIVEINPADMTITVEAGVTWQQIYKSLDPLGLRLPFFGTFSGSRATVGGGLSNGALFFGTARYGTAAESVLGLEVVTATGKVIATGQAGFNNGKAFYRTYGPDMTGLFVHDAGALGIKTLISMRMIRKPAINKFASFIFRDSQATTATLTEIARSGNTEEAYVFDPETTRRAFSGSDIAGDIKRLISVVRSEKSLEKGLREGINMAVAGKNFIEDGVYSLHVACAGETEASANHDIKVCRSVAHKNNGQEIANTIPKAARAQPFSPLNSILGADGDRWAALNSKVALSDADAIIAATLPIFEKHATEMEHLKITFSQLMVAISNHAFSYEPVLRWYDEWLPVHKRTPDPAHLATLKVPQANPEARKLVAQIRHEIVDVFAEFGAASNQIGKTYPYYQSLKPETAELILAIKRVLDPNDLMNPGALGFTVNE